MFLNIRHKSINSIFLVYIASYLKPKTMSETLKQWLSIRSKNQRLYDSTIGAIKKQVQLNDPEPVIKLYGEKQIGLSLFVFEIIIAIDMDEMLVDESANGWNVNHEVVSIDFVQFDITNDSGVSILTDTQRTLLKNTVDVYLRNAYTI